MWTCIFFVLQDSFLNVFDNLDSSTHVCVASWPEEQHDSNMFDDIGPNTVHADLHMLLSKVATFNKLSNMLRVQMQT